MSGLLFTSKGDKRHCKSEAILQKTCTEFISALTQLRPLFTEKYPYTSGKYRPKLSFLLTY